MAEAHTAFVTDAEQRLLEVEELRLACKFGSKRRYTDAERAAAGLAWYSNPMRELDVIEAVFRRLNADDEAAAARRDLGG